MINQNERDSTFDISPEQFRKLGYELVDQFSMYLDAIGELPVTSKKSVETIREAIGQGSLPVAGKSIEEVWEGLPRLLLDHSLINGHPRFWGYIMGSPSPEGALADMLASMINPNMGGWDLAPIASEIETQVVTWLADLIGYAPDCGGLLVSGGAMANYTAFLAARRAIAGNEVRETGLREIDQQLTVYASKETHTWIQKAADLFGIGTNYIRWLATDSSDRILTSALREAIDEDISHGYRPFIVIGTAGTVSTGAVDPLNDIADICEEFGLWFHVDGAYGAPAACLPSQSKLFSGMERADSIALDPHKWLYAPFEAGCTLVRNKQALLDAYSYRPLYYHFDENAGLNYYEHGFQNSRGFRALKVWVNLQRAGRDGYEQMIGDDIRLAEMLASEIQKHRELELKSQNLSIVTFRFYPKNEQGKHLDDEELNALNQKIMAKIQRDGKAFFTNAVINGEFLLRVCIVNFRTSRRDIEALPGLVASTGSEIHAGTSEN